MDFTPEKLLNNLGYGGESANFSSSNAQNKDLIEGNSEWKTRKNPN
jgi:hypothetical protein